MLTLFALARNAHHDCTQCFHWRCDCFEHARDAHCAHSSGEEHQWDQNIQLLSSLEGDLSENAILKFATVIIGKADVAVLTYAPIGEALEGLESRLCSSPPTMIGTENCTGTGNDTKYAAVRGSLKAHVGLQTTEDAASMAENGLCEAQFKSDATGHATVGAKANQASANTMGNSERDRGASQHVVTMARAMLEHSGMFVLQYGPERSEVV